MTQAKIYRTRLTQAWLIVFAMSIFSFAMSFIRPFSTLGISPLIISVLIGAVIGNASLKANILVKRSGVLSILTKQILRFGVILFGFRITIDEVLIVGVGGIVSAFIIVFSTFFIGYFVGIWLGLDKKLAVLVSAGSSICGAAAVLATESVVKGGANRVAIAICSVVVFGTFGMFLYPSLYGIYDFGLSNTQAGFFTGISLHEVAHVVASGNAIGDEAAVIAVIVKMLRVLMLVPFLIFLSLFSLKFLGQKGKGSIKSSFPYFAVWFLIAMAVGSLPFFPRESLIFWINLIDTFLLCMAMGGLGLTITKSTLTHSIKVPLLVALIMFVWLIFAGFILAKIVA